MKDNITIYDKKELYDSEIKETVEKLTRLLEHHGFPYAIVIAVENDSEKTEYVKEVLGARPLGVELADDKIVDVIKLVMGRGFRMKYDGGRVSELDL